MTCRDCFFNCHPPPVSLLVPFVDNSPRRSQLSVTTLFTVAKYLALSAASPDSDLGNKKQPPAGSVRREDEPPISLHLLDYLIVCITRIAQVTCPTLIVLQPPPPSPVDTCGQRSERVTEEGNKGHEAPMAVDPVDNADSSSSISSKNDGDPKSRPSDVPAGAGNQQSGMIMFHSAWPSMLPSKINVSDFLVCYMFRH